MKIFRWKISVWLLTFFFSYQLLYSNKPLNSINPGGHRPNDTFFVLDVSRSMLQESSISIQSSQDNNIFNEVKDRLIKDIQSRRVGDYISIHIFGEGDPRLVDQRVIQAETDKNQLVEAVHGIEANDDYTWLDVAMLKVFYLAKQRAEEYKDNNVDIRIYTDGANNGPNLTEEINAHMDLNTVDVPNLMVYFMQYIHSNASSRTETLMKTAAERARNLNHINTPFSAIFPHVDWGKTDFGNLRSEGFEQPLTFVFSYDSKLENEAFDIKTELVQVRGQRPLINILPRPFRMTTEAVRETFKIENANEIPEDKTVEFSGYITFHAVNEQLSVNFRPPRIPFSGRIAPLRQYKIRFIQEGGTEVSKSVFENTAISIGISNKKLIYTDQGIPNSVYFKVEVEGLNNSKQTDTFELQVRPSLDTGLDENAARFVSSIDDTDPGQNTAEVDPSMNDLYLRIWYKTSFLDRISRPGYYPVEVTATSEDPDISCVFVIPDVVSPSGEPVYGVGAKIVRLFPGTVPSDQDFSNYMEDPLSWTRSKGGGSVITPPPGKFLKFLVLFIMGLILGSILHFICFVSRGLSIILFLLFIIIAWFFGGWSGILILPKNSLDSAIWVFWGLLSLISIFFPACFAYTPWGVKGWVLQNKKLWPISRKKRKKTWIRWPFMDRNTITIGGQSGRHDINEAHLSGRKFTFYCPKSSFGFLPVKYIRIQANDSGVAINGETLEVGRTKLLIRGAKITCGGRTYIINRT